jgi:hypothetical protein
MSLTKELMVHTEEEVARLPDDLLRVYYITHRRLNNQYPNSYYEYRRKVAFEEIMRRGIEDESL